MEDTVRLAVPATAEYMRLGRVTASGLASRLGFTYEEIDDLRLAIDELCGAMLSMGSGTGSITLEYAVHDDGLEITGSAIFPGETGPLEVNEWSSRILEALVDEHSITEKGGSPRFHLVKHRSEGQ